MRSKDLLESHMHHWLERKLLKISYPAACNGNRALAEPNHCICDEDEEVQADGDCCMGRPSDGKGLRSKA